MLFYCEYTWHAGTNTEMVRARHDRQHKAGELRLDLCRGWYNFAGSGQGFLLVEADDATTLALAAGSTLSLLALLATPRPAPESVEELLGLLELLPLPAGALSPEWQKMMDRLNDVTQGQQPKRFLERQAAELLRRRPAPSASAAPLMKPGARPAAKATPISCAMRLLALLTPDASPSSV